MAAGFAEAVCFDGTAFATVLRAGGVAFEVGASVFGSFALAFFGGAALPATGRFGVLPAPDTAFFEIPFDAGFVAAGAGLAFPFEFAFLARPSCERVAGEACVLDAGFLPVDIAPADFFTTDFAGGLAAAPDGRLEAVLFAEAALPTDLPSRFGVLFGRVCSLPGDFRGGGASTTALLLLAASAWLFGGLLAAGAAAVFAGALTAFSFFRVVSGFTASEAEFRAVEVDVPRGIS